jgi:hypothetical protein
VKVGKHTLQMGRGGGEVLSKVRLSKVVPVAQQCQCLDLDGYLSITKSEQGVEIWIVLRSGFW